MNSSIFKKGLMIAALLFAASSSYASLILVSAEDFGGSGLGAVDTVLTIQGKGRDGIEEGSVSRLAGNDFITGDAKTGASQTLTRTFSELGLTSAANIRVVFNAVESNDDSIVLTNLVLNLYGANDVVLFSSGLFTPVTFENTFSGTGNSGFVFALDATQAAQAQLAAFSAGPFGAYRVGLSASASDSDSGSETFYVANSLGGGGNGNTVPEPTTIALLGLGLLGFAASRRKAKAV